MSNKFNQRLKRIEREVAKAERAERDYYITEWRGLDKHYKAMQKKNIAKKRAIEARAKRRAMERAWWNTVNNNEYIEY